MSLSHERQIPKRIITIVVVTLTLIVLLIYMQGGFIGKVSPGTSPQPDETHTFHTATVTAQQVGDVLSWPGVVKSRTVADIAPRLTARILDIKVHAGDAVKKGDVIARLDERDLRAQEKAALAVLTGANAQANRASADQQRISGLYEKEAATRANHDAAVALAKEAQARVHQASSMLNEIRARLADTVLLAPFDGTIVKRLKQPGDMGMPGVPIVALQAPRSLRLEVEVPAACAGAFQSGEGAAVRIDTFSQIFSATIDEIIPEIDAHSHSQLIKIALPAIEGLKPGYFGWLQQACDEHVALLIPASAVQYLGQLEIVRVLADGRQIARHIRTGKTFGDRIEVISGLRVGETIIADPRHMR